MAHKVVAVIPARSGSKRIPGKNTRDFNGRPMIAWPIVACQASESVARIIVSTDSPEIATIAREFGAETPFLRPEELSNDTAGTAPVIRHAIQTLGLDDEDWVLCVYPTAAIDTTFLNQAISQTSQPQIQERFLISVGRHQSPIERALVRNDEGTCEMIRPDALHSRTQSFSPTYFDAGKFYLAGVRTWMQHETMMAHPFVPFFLPEWAAVDVDEEGDWVIAETLHQKFGSSRADNALDLGEVS